MATMNRIHANSRWRAKGLVLALIASSASVICGEVVGNVNIVKTGDYDGRSFAEPSKITVLSLTAEEAADLADYDHFEWNVVFMPVVDEIWPEYQEKVFAEEVAGHSYVADLNMEGGNQNTASTMISHMFKLPGTYQVTVVGSSTSSKQRQGKVTKRSKTTKKKKPTKSPKMIAKEPKTPKSGKSSKKPKTRRSGKASKSSKSDREEVVLASSIIRVRYARRDVIDLSPSDWNKYVEAIWTLRELSSGEGQRRFNCPNFHNLDVFTAMHGVISNDPRCDQNHFSLMQEVAHHAWMTLLEKSLQCVHPSIAMPFYNVAKDKRKYYNPDVGAKSMLDSPIFGPDYYGGGAANWDDRADVYDPYYVEDGRFANFPLRQNRTELCDESKGLFDDTTYIPLCKSILESSDYKGWKNADPTTSGLWLHEPRDDSHYKYVSARRWHIYNDVGDVLLRNVVPSHEMVHTLTYARNAAEQFKYVSLAKIHGYAHKLLSGMWGGGIDETTIIAPNAALNKGKPLLETLRKFSGLLVLFAWNDELAIRDAGCFQCTKEGCTINMENAIAKNCYNIQNNFAIPTNRTQPVWSDSAEEGSFWYKYLDQMNMASWMKFVLYGFGSKHANSGTFARHTWANQDPLFYVHHAYTFLLNDFGLSKLVESGRASPPLYGLDTAIDERGVPECPGQNPKDTSPYRNIVRYKVGQQPETDQTWEHMLDMWSEDRRDYEWVINDEFITDYDSTLRYDASCQDGCTDEAQIIVNAFPPGNTLTLEEMCQQFIAGIQAKTGLSKEDTCAMKLKDINAFGLPFLPANFDLYSYSCKKTCNFCKPTCGDIEA